ncbi:MAG TPA: glycosyltransferase family 2 protein [Candidatus Saccharimonadia bacterium]|nr:glycosyltransferase family 2 protein [Candidatus Saccharimonadia bacterium]
MKIAIVIPALDEALAIREVVSDTLALGHPVYVVDDGSRDGTGAAIADLPVTVVRHERTLGTGQSLKDGFAAALADGATAVVTLDGDGQHAAADVPRRVAAHLRSPTARVLCARTQRLGPRPALRHFANAFADFWVSWACGVRVLDSQCGQRLYPRALIESVALPASGGFTFESEILIEAARAGFPIAGVPIFARYHAGRRPSHFRPVADILKITRMVAWKLARRGMFLGGLVRSRARGPILIDS